MQQPGPTPASKPAPVPKPEPPASKPVPAPSVPAAEAPAPRRAEPAPPAQSAKLSKAEREKQEEMAFAAVYSEADHAAWRLAVAGFDVGLNRRELPPRWSLDDEAEMYAFKQWQKTGSTKAPIKTGMAAATRSATAGPAPAPTGSLETTFKKGFLNSTPKPGTRDASAAAASGSAS